LAVTIVKIKPGLNPNRGGSGGVKKRATEGFFERCLGNSPGEWKGKTVPGPPTPDLSLPDVRT